MANPIVIDISHWQPTPDWQALKDGGTVGVILKATEGASYVDETFKSRWAALKQYGFSRSAYHFLRPGDMVAQMQRFISVVEPSDTERLCIDYEDDAVSFSDLERAALTLIDAGFQTTIYGSNILVDACKGKRSEILSRTSLWQARYSANEPAVPTNIWPTWSLWQYTDKAKVTGLNVVVDGNHWNGTPANLPAWFDSSKALPPITSYPEPDEPDPTPEVQEVSVEMMISGQATVFVNGRKVFP